MAGIQMFDLGPPRVDTFNMLSNLGQSFFNAYDKQRERQAQDRKWATEEEDKKLWGDYAKSLGGPADTPAQPSRAVSEVGTTTPTPSPRPPSFSQTGGQMRGVNTSGFTPALSSLIDEFKQTFPDVRITSGYRDPSYNAKVGGAKGSQHIHGNAFDFSVRGLPEERQLEIANWLRSKGAQGFGYYPNSQSMHADLGAPRAWGPSYGRDSLGQTPKWFQQFAGNAQPVEPPSGPPPVSGRSMVAYAGVPRTQVASAAPGLGYTPAPAPMPMPVPRPDAAPQVASFDEAVPGATTMASLGGMAGAPTMPLPAPQAAPVAAPAPPPAPAPMQVAQAAPAAPMAPAAPAGDPLQEAFRRLPPARQQWVARALQNPLTRPAALAQLQAMVKQDTAQIVQDGQGNSWFFNPTTRALTPTGLPGKPQDRYIQERDASGNLLQRNVTNNQASILEAREKEAEAVRKVRTVRDNWQQLGLPDPNNPQNAGWWQEFGQKALAGGGVSVSINDEVEQRKRAATAAGLTPDKPGYQAFILTGRMPREDQQPLSAGDKKAILEADELVLAGETVISNLNRAKELSKSAYAAPGAATGATVGAFFGDQRSKDTIELNNLVLENALGQLKATFGAAPTEGERKILIELQGAVSQPHDVRAKIFERAMQLAQKRLDFNRRRAEELRGGSYYKTDDQKAKDGPAKQAQPERMPVPPAAARDLRSGADTPERRRQFDEVFGPGAADEVLKRRP